MSFNPSAEERIYMTSAKKILAGMLAKSRRSPQTLPIQPEDPAALYVIVVPPQRVPSRLPDRFWDRSERRIASRRAGKRGAKKPRDPHRRRENAAAKRWSPDLDD